jgi:hypothetical protein
MDMPKPTAEHKTLERLTGTWRGTETMHPSEWNPKGSTAEGVTTSRRALGGFGVVTDYTQSIDGQVTFSGHGVYTIDPKTSDVVLYWFDSIGMGCEEFRGGWTGDTLTLLSRSPTMGHMRMTYDFQSDGTLHSSMESSPDEAVWTRMFDGVYSRAG